MTSWADVVRDGLLVTVPATATWLATRQTAKHEQRKWDRDDERDRRRRRADALQARHEIYALFLARVGEVMSLAVGVMTASAPLTQAEADAISTRLAGAMEDITITGAQMKLVAPKAVDDAARGLMTFLMETTAVLRGDIQMPGVAEKRAFFADRQPEYHAAVDRLCAAAREEDPDFVVRPMGLRHSAER